MSHTSHQSEKGAVSIFVVVFVALLISVLTVSFIQLIIKNQQQASDSDLSQSAYDSALAGVEDAKRALVLDKKCVAHGGALAGVDCVRLAAALASNTCSGLKQYYEENPLASGEVPIKRDFGTGGEQDILLDQAYTCVKVAKSTPDYRRTDLSNAKSHLIPLQARTTFNKVKISWFTMKDVGVESSADANLVWPADSTGVSLPATAEAWGTTADAAMLQTPPLLRAQLMQTGSSFSLSQLDEPAGGRSNAATLFLYPSTIGSPEYSFSADTHTVGKSSPKTVSCNATTYKNGGYACSITLSLPAPIDNDTAHRNAFLRLSALYNTTRYKVELLNGSTPVDFYGVQTEVDATGRANDIFRRVKSRVELTSTDYPYPEQEIYLYGDLCKNFIVTNRAGDYSNTCLESAD